MYKPVLVLLLLASLSCNVEGKAVKKKIKRSLYPGSSYSYFPQRNPQWISHEQKANEHVYWSSATRGSGYAGNSKLGEFSGSNSNHNSNKNYDIASYENFQQMFDSDLKQKKSPNDNFKPLESDQVFLHHDVNKETKRMDHKFTHNLRDDYSIVHSKGKLQSKTFSDERSVDPDKTLPSIESSSLSTESQKLGISEIEHINVSTERLEPSLPLENKTNVSSESKNLRTEEIGVLVGMSRNFESGLHSNTNDSVINIEDKNLFKVGINQMFEASFDSFIFNPSAQPLEKSKKCKTPRNETGFCRYVQNCMLPGILNSIQHFMENVCIIEGRFIGVCCPEFPVQTVRVEWENQFELFDNGNSSVEIPQDCGVGANTRIVGGSDADRKAWLWMVALLNDKNKFFCGGSLINSRYVLTAAHCTLGNSKNRIVARLGEYDFTNPREPHDDYRVVEIKRHGQYNSISLRNDIALLKLEKPVVFNEFVQTICFPEAVKDYIGNVTTLVGWGNLNGGSGGTSDVLQVASFPVISNDQCSSMHRMTIPSSLICAAATTRDKGACNGDSGGPLMLLDENERWKVIGIVSWGRRGCNPEFPTVYTRVTHYMDWIRKHST